MSRGVKKKRPDTYHHGDLRRAMIEAALRAVEREGVEALSLRAVARSLGVSPRAPYRHFATKEELLAAVAVEGIRLARAFTEERLASVGDDPVERLRVAVEAYVLFAARHPAAFKVMYAPYATVHEEAPDLLRARSEGHAAMMACIVAGQEAGTIRDGDPMLLGLGLLSGMHGLAVLLVEGQLGRYDRPVVVETLAASVTRFLFEGLLPRPEPRAKARR
jgi:AcrR family transcriptional regulator